MLGLQTTATAAAAAANDTAQAAQEKTLSIMDMIVGGGAANVIIIGILFVMLGVALYIYFERLLAIRAVSKVDNTFIYKIRDNIASGKIEAAKLLCAQSNLPAARLIEKGLSRIGKPLEDINKAIENAGTLEVYKLEKNTAILATIAGAGPMIGFLGTVVGMILSFHEMASAGGQAEMGALAGGIYTAMTTTVAGLIVGIIAYVGYNHLVVNTDKVVHTMEANAVDFLDLLNEPF
jgi:motA/tolQ/exbB family biopolymer transport protein